jgi:hypothetical protein
MENVTSIDVEIYEPHLPHWDEGTCSKLKTALPSLRRILFHEAIYDMWELQGKTWSMRAVGEFTPWDTIRGGCDDL